MSSYTREFRGSNVAATKRPDMLDAALQSTGWRNDSGSSSSSSSGGGSSSSSFQPPTKRRKLSDLDYEYDGGESSSSSSSSNSGGRGRISGDFDFGFNSTESRNMVSDTYKSAVRQNTSSSSVSIDVQHQHSNNYDDDEEHLIHSMMNGYVSSYGSSGGVTPMSSVMEAGSSDHHCAHPDAVKAFFRGFGHQMERRLGTINAQEEPEYNCMFSNLLNNQERFRRIRHQPVPRSDPTSAEDECAYVFYVKMNVAATSRTPGVRSQPNVEDARMHGITKLLAYRFWPGRTGDFSHIPERVKASANVPCSSGFMRLCHGRGMAHGTHCHGQVHSIVSYLNEKSEKSTRSLADIMESYLYEHPDPPIDPCTIRILRKMNESRMIPFRTEFPIFSEAGWATKVDLIGYIISEEAEAASLKAEADGIKYDPIAVADNGLYVRGKSVIIELKFGYENEYFKHTVEGDLNMMNLDELPFRIPDTPYERASMQLGLTALTMGVCYNFKPQLAFIWSVFPKQGHLWQHALPDWFRKKENRSNRVMFYKKCTELISTEQLNRVTTRRA